MDACGTPYRHAEHAGNFADLFKHTLLIALLTALRAHGAPLVYIESHAGAGRYTLGPSRTRHLAGLATPGDSPHPASWARLVAMTQGTDERMAYPGSPWLAARLLGPRDRLVLVERAERPWRRLVTLFAGDARVECRLDDGYHAVPDLLPPAVTPGLLLIDPPYAREGETEDVLSLLAVARTRWPQGTLAIWYPRRGDGVAGRLHAGLRARFTDGAVDCWIERRGPAAHGMRGCGVVLINPPGGFTSGWEATGSWLATRLFRGGTALGGIGRLA